jgi:hypothetical protein
MLIMFEMSSPKNIYTTILGEVGKLIQSFDSHSKDDEIKKAQAEAWEQLNILQQEIKDSLNQLEKNSEWDVFTLAFYGETNAGKSTLIETLRVLLNEPKKAREREEFAKAFAQHNELQNKIERCQSSINSIVFEYKDQFTGIENQLLEVAAQLKQINDQVKLAQDEIEKAVDIVKKEKKSSLIKLLKSIFGKLPEQKKLKEAKMLLSGIENEKDAYVKQQNSVNQKKEDLNREVEEKTKQLNVELVELQENAASYTKKLIANVDGKTIGDGRSDFTRAVTSYEFEIKGQKFSLLDLPGIEGNEGLVLDTINSAVQKAHAVFYITTKPTPPQTGDKNSEGTIDKIKKHLGQQTEVYAIFNKRVKNPNSLKDTLIDSDEMESLKVLDKTMRSYLGEQYQESISVSAYPAFLAVANCWGEGYLPQKEKFMEHFNTAEAILDKSRIQIFSDQLTGDMVQNSKAKIKKSNFKKATVVLEHTTEEIKNIHQVFLKVQQKLIETKRSTDDQLDNAADVLKGGLDMEAHTAIENFKNDIRTKIYEDIDADIDNNDFKSALEERTKKGVEILQGNLENTFKDQIDKFQENVSDIVQKYQDNAVELLNAYTGAEKFGAEFNFNIDIKSDKTWIGAVASVVSSIIGIIMLSVGTGGVAAIVAIVIGVIGAIFSLVKAIVGFFDHSYRQSQQRKNADKILEKSGEDIYKSIKANLNDCFKTLKTGIENVKSELTNIVEHIKEINKILEKAKSEFKTMAKAITQEGVK